MFTKFLFALLLAVTLFTQAAPLTEGAPLATPADNACIVLILDESGSMGDNDSTFLRNTGAKLFISLLDDGDRVGIVRFSTGATRLTPGLVALRAPEDKMALLNLLSDTPPDGFTDMRAALVEAAALLQNADCGARYILFLSDGQPQLPAGLPADYDSQTLNLAQSLNAPILGIALTASGESGLLYRLAAVTNGAVIPARTASDLLDAYLEAISRLKDRTVIGSGFTQSPGSASLPLEPGLAQYVSRVTYIVVKPDNISATLVAPGGELLTPDDPRLAFAYTADPRFAVYTVDVPAPGDWRFALDGSGLVQARAILRSRLRVVVSQPGTYHPLGAPMPLAVSLIEEERDGTTTTLIGEASFSAFIIRPDGSQDALDQLYDDGTHDDAHANDGVFTNAYVKTDLGGDYQIAITGYKGAIPATRAVRVLTIPFPQITVLSPVEPQFEFRGQPLILAMHLVGGEPPTLDSGAFVARITDPAGATNVIPLAPAEGGFIATFAPARDGPHTIEFVPQDALYKGVAYTLTAGRVVDMRLIPTIRLADDSLNLGTVEVGELARGLPLQLNVISSGPQAETVGFELVGLPGLAVANVAPSQIPGGASVAHLTLKGDLLPGNYTAMLLLSVRDGVDLPRREVPIAINVYQPSLAVAPDMFDLGSIHIDRVQEGQELVFNITSNSPKDELFTLTWNGPGGVHVETAVTSIPAGETVKVPVRIWGDGLTEGNYSGQVQVASRGGVMVSPPTINVAFVVVPTPWCARWCLPLGALGVGSFIVASVIASYLASRSRPWGTLKPTKVPAGQTPPSPINLASSAGLIHAGQVVIGSGNGAGIRLTGGKVRPAHAAVKLTRQSVTERVGKPPKPMQVEKLVNVVENLSDGLVKVNNVAVPKGQRSVPLRSGLRVVIGEYEFEYRE